MKNAVFELKKISVERGEKSVFSDVSFSVFEGENTVILGPNGAGKSTLLKLFTREIYPVFDARSSISIFGESSWDVRELRKRLGVVSADFQKMIPAGTRGIEVVLSGFFGGVGVFRDQAVRRFHRSRGEEILERLGISHLREREFSTLSTGEQRRLILGRALISEPRALILDEPTSGLDLRSAILYVETLRELMRAGTTLVLVTHNVSEISPEINKAVLLKAGKIVGNGEIGAVLTSENLSALFEIPLKVCRSRGFFSVVPAEIKRGGGF